MMKVPCAQCQISSRGGCVLMESSNGAQNVHYKTKMTKKDFSEMLAFYTPVRSRLMSIYPYVCVTYTHNPDGMPWLMVTIVRNLYRLQAILPIIDGSVR
uniref:Uncharacterized protein n=1 Tax=Anguilla anguilla TaxID=7936 RepID=A0A0E9RQQ7_ANGAN